MGAPFITGKGIDKLAASWSYAPSKQGQTCAIDLSDDNAHTSWLVVVKAQGKEGEYILGTVRTRAPIAGDPKSRTILIAWHPGVVKWAFDFFGPVGATARPVIAATECECGGAGAFGIVPQNGSRLVDRIWDVPPAPIVAGNQGILSPGPDALTKVYASKVDPATPAGFFGLIDTDVAVVNGDAWRVAPVPVVAGLGVIPFPYPLDPTGIDFLLQARWAYSSTFANVTLVGAAGVIAQAERL